MLQPGDLSADGLTVTHTATNLSGDPAPYAAGMHPYLTVGEPTVGRLDALELLLPAATRCLVDDRKLPTTDEPVEGTAFDFRVPRLLRDTVLDHAFTDLARDERGRAVVELRDPADGQGVALWVDAAHGWLQVFSADEPQDDLTRRSLAVEPMIAPADAFNSGRDLRVLAPAGESGDECSAASPWGIWAPRCTRPSGWSQAADRWESSECAVASLSVVVLEPGRKGGGALRRCW